MLIDIQSGRLDDPRVIELLTIHVNTARAQTAPGSAHALDLSGLRSPDIRFWTAWDGETLLGTAAMRRLSASHGEVKSMHVAKSARRLGVGSALVRNVIETARADGMERLSLETGARAFFEPARALYARHGFTGCGPFGEYVDDPNSVFMPLRI
jgi:putative acetyltransferase